MLEALLERIYARHPTQQKKVEQFFSRVPSAKKDLTGFLNMYAPFLKQEGVSVDALADAYSEMVDQMFMCRVHFLRTGQYPLNSQDDAFAQVYDNKPLMTQYMFGAALSQYLWEAHYKLMNFYLAQLAVIGKNKRFLEVGCGHGIYVNHVLKHIGDAGRIDVVDISDTSIYLAGNILKTVNPQAHARVNFIKSDITAYKTDKKYDFIGMGEVLEHVDNPQAVLSNLRSLLSDEGRLFMTTCANCPTIDHVYLFNNIEEIRKMIAEQGLEIEKEIVAPSEDKSLDYLMKYKVDISYGAILKKR